MIRLFGVFLQIALIRKGPADIPSSEIFLLVAFAAWLATLFLMVPVVEWYTASDITISILSNLLSLYVYTIVLALRGGLSRALPMLTAMVGTGAVLAFTVLCWQAFVVSHTGPGLAQVVPMLLVFWFVQVEANIISKAAKLPFLAGVMVAVLVFLLQFMLEITLSPETS